MFSNQSNWGRILTVKGIIIELLAFIKIAILSYLLDVLIYLVIKFIGQPALFASLKYSSGVYVR